MPLTSVLSGAKLGVSAFFDAGKVYDVGQSQKDAPWHKGVGGGVFLIATIVRINLDVAHGLKDGDTRVHFEFGVFVLGRAPNLQSRATRCRCHPNIVRTTNHTLAGRSARRRMYHGNQYSP